MLRAVLFDLDDTLFDHRHSTRTGLGYLQTQLPRLAEISLDDLELVNLELLEEIHFDVLSGAITPDEARLRRFSKLFARYDIAIDRRFDELTEGYREAYVRSRKTVEGTHELMQRLRDRSMKIGILSNNLVEEQLSKIAQLGLERYYDSLTISEEAGYSKPDPRIFHIALGRLGCRAEEVVMIGDAWVNDVQGALAVGIKAIWYNRFLTESPDPSVPEIRSLEDSERILSLLDTLSHALEKSKGEIDS